MIRITNEQREAIVRKAISERDRLLADCAGGSPCSTCPDKRKCQRGCVRIPDFISTEFHKRQEPDLLRIRAAIAGDRCDGDSEYAAGVNAACANHLALIDEAIRANPSPSPTE